MRKHCRLGVNIDHVATLRQARGVNYPDPIQAAKVAEESGADGITLHLREDRRHIQDDDVVRMMSEVQIPVNLEMAATEEVIQIAVRLKPKHVCLVPEKREELTTEGGLDVAGSVDHLTDVCRRLRASDIQVSLFIDPDPKQIKAASLVGAPIVELHTGAYADVSGSKQQAELDRLRAGAKLAHDLGLVVNAGHGLTLDNMASICQLPHMNELNIGHALVADAIFMGFAGAVAAYKAVLTEIPLVSV